MARGDVYNYTPEDWTCAEGMAVENQYGVLVDTFWGVSNPDPFLSKVVRRSLVVGDAIGNIHEFERVPRGESVWDYSEEDRFVVTSQHALEQVGYRRRGAEPDLDAMIERAKKKVDDAQVEADVYNNKLQQAKEKLRALLEERGSKV